MFIERWTTRLFRPKAERSPSPGQRPGSWSDERTPSGPTGQPFLENGWPVGPEDFPSSTRSPGRCPGLGERLPLWGKNFWGKKLARLHRDERGSISIVSVFTALLLTMLLGMVMNVGRQVDGKIRMQNAADAAAYSGGLELTRAMNTLSFTNHLMCEIFAMTAILRESSDPQQFPQYNGQQSAKHVPEILAAWMKGADILKQSSFDKYQKLGADLQIHLPQEQQLVTVFSQWGAAFSAEVLPVLECILQNELIPEYQRAVVAVYPEIAQAAAMEVARRNGDPDYGRGQMLAALWRGNGQLVGDPSYEPTDRTMPVVDPVLDMLPDQAGYLAAARQQRYQLAKMYLNQWNGMIFEGFDYLAPFSKFKELWEKITCGHLEKLLSENGDKNLPFQIRKLNPPFDPTDLNIAPGTYNAQLEGNYIFTGVVYWKKAPELMSRIFNTPTESDALAYAEVHIFLPKRRLVWRWNHPGSKSIPTYFGPLSQDPSAIVDLYWSVDRQYSSYFETDWNLLSQNWACQLAPATQRSLDVILQTAPPRAEFNGVQMPTLGNLKSDGIQKISPH